MSRSRRDPSSLSAMRRTAGGLLLAMTGLYVGTHLLAPPAGAWGYVRAFAEAAMIGGLADWFAVTAIFRQPFGLPIPHTGVIPRHQGRIADAVGAFIRDHFLEPQLVSRRLETADLSEAAARWLNVPSQASALAAGLTSLIPGLLETLEEEEAARFLREQVEEAARGGRLAPLLASILESLIRQGRHQALLDALAAEGFRLLEEQGELIRSKVRERTGWVWRLIRLDHRAADALILALEDLLGDIARDSTHPVRDRIRLMATRFAADLRQDPLLQTRLETWLSEAMTHPEVASSLETGWIEARSAIRRDCLAADSRIRSFIEGLLRGLAHDLLEQQAMRDTINRRLRPMISEFARRHGDDVAAFISHTIRDWDARTLADTLEAHVGRDLQFIRINGTVIGGLIGLALHAGGDLLDHL